MHILHDKLKCINNYILQILNKDRHFCRFQSGVFYKCKFEFEPCGEITIFIFYEELLGRRFIYKRSESTTTPYSEIEDYFDIKLWERKIKLGNLKK